MRRTFLELGLLVAVTASACSGGGENPPDAAPPDVIIYDAPPPPIDAVPPKPILKRPSKSSTVATSDDDKYVIVVNPGDNSISIFRTSDLSLSAKVATGLEPSSVVIAPDNTTAYVANRAEATVVKVSGIDQVTPSVSQPLAVGSEPTGVALTPTGETLYVAELAEGSIAVVDTASMTVSSVLKASIKHPRGLTVTNNGDQKDSDELLIVPEFYGEPTDEANDASKLDKSRQGRVHVFAVSDLSEKTPIVFTAHDSGIVPDIAGVTASVFTSPNQLFSVTLRRDPTTPADNSKNKIYVTSISASPQPPTRYNGNVFPVVYVGNLADSSENTTSAGTVNLAKKLLDASPVGLTGKRFLADIVDMSFIPAMTTGGGITDGNVAYVLSRGSDTIQRVTFDDSAGVSLGAPSQLQIDMLVDNTLLNGCKIPTGIVVSNDGARAYVNCLANHRLGIVDLGATQALNTTKEAYPLDNDATDRGRRFFFTGRGRWSGNGQADTGTPPNVTLHPPTVSDLAFSSCGSCHPDGLSDNITWIFDTGPRQSTSLDGSFSKGQGAQRQRVFNWTGVNDEVHDFERNTRGVSGGMGAITTAATGQCNNLASETRQILSGALAQPVIELEQTAGNCRTDWDDILAWMKTIRPPHGLTRLDPDQVTNGRAIFGLGQGINNANCLYCHGGAGWTISHVFWTPSTATNAALTTAPFSGGAPWPPSWNGHSFQIEVEQPTLIAPPQVACVQRNVGTFDSESALEKKPDLVSPAQGAGGFNVPSLYGVALGAPYYHNGSARTLDDVLTTTHMQLGNPNFGATADQRAALEAFILSIDANSTEIPEAADPPTAIPGGFDKCPASFRN